MLGLLFLDFILEFLYLHHLVFKALSFMLYFGANLLMILYSESPLLFFNFSASTKNLVNEYGFMLDS